MGSPALHLSRVARHLDEAQLLRAAQGDQKVEVRGVSQDSREISTGDLFLAWRGVDHDGHDYVASAVEAGAVAAVVERLLPEVDVGQLQVTDGRLAGALAADLILGSPWTDLFLTGITGTNGKTTVTALSRHLLGLRGPARAMGTLGLIEEDGTPRVGTEGLTTPGPVRISSWLRQMVDEGTEYVALEASSHALAQRRLDGTRVDVAVFTNLTQDHLDYHVDLDGYRAAKLHLLDLLKPGGWAVVNRDEEAWSGLSAPPHRTVGYGVADETGGPSRDAPGEGVVLEASDVQLGPDGSSFHLRLGDESASVELPLLGRFNVENALAAAGVAWVAGMSLPGIAGGLARAPQIRGRLERVVNRPVPVLLDYAHTPDALERVLDTLRPLTRGRLLVLFGAGGDRDRGKRPRMGEVAARLADLSFVTSDNPRTEDPEVIIQEILAGMAGAPCRKITDRREAIAAALEEAEAGDLLLLAGKGHETYQVLGREKTSFDEAAIVRELLGTAGEEEVDS